RIEARLMQVRDHLLNGKTYDIDDAHFIWPAKADRREPALRQRDHSEPVRDATLVPLEEFARAARELARIQFGIARDELAAQVARVLGLPVGSVAIERVRMAIDAEISAGELTMDDAHHIRIAQAKR